MSMLLQTALAAETHLAEADDNNHYNKNDNRIFVYLLGVGGRRLPLRWGGIF
jgi:hypothetical protein